MEKRKPAKESADRQKEQARKTDLKEAIKKLAHQVSEREKRASELILANRELVYQNQEKENRAAELIIANRELAFQNDKKEKRASELLIANIEMAHQFQEKENLTAELLLANHELINANEELAYQNAEKGEITMQLLKSNEELHDMQIQLVDSNKELESFSYSVSHDLRAPLRAIIGFSEVLQEEYATALDTEAIRIISVIVDNAQVMSHLIDDLLRFSRLARLEAVNYSINVESIVQNNIRKLMSPAGAHVPEIVVNALPQCNGDESMLIQVWFNLLDNAIKYSSKKTHPKIEIGCRQEDDRLVYYVRDNGAGFDMKYYGKLFGVFQRLHNTDEFEGTGLGLALVKRILNKHHGQIWAESVLEEGTTFYFSIPK